MKILLSILAGCYISISIVFGLYEFLALLDSFFPDVKTPKIIKIINRINLGIFLVLGITAMIWFFSFIFYILICRVL